MNICRKCGLEKTVSEFSKTNKGVYSNLCKDCAAELQRDWYDNHKDKRNITRAVKRLNTTLQTMQLKANEVGLTLKIDENLKVFLEEK